MKNALMPATISPAALEELRGFLGDTETVMAYRLGLVPPSAPRDKARQSYRALISGVTEISIPITESAMRLERNFRRSQQFLAECETKGAARLARKAASGA